jgi:hypothetical protein
MDLPSHREQVEEGPTSPAIARFPRPEDDDRRRLSRLLGGLVARHWLRRRGRGADLASQGASSSDADNA